MSDITNILETMNKNFINKDTEKGAETTVAAGKGDGWAEIEEAFSQGPNEAAAGRYFDLGAAQLPERVFLLGLSHHRLAGELDPQASLEELDSLAQTAGGLVVDSLMVNRDRPDAAHYFGKGKIDEINALISEKTIDLVIIDDELSIRQQQQLDRRLRCRVIDRTALILQIFADHAHTREGKLQIELAQLSYLMPRLTGQGTALSRLGGGIGTRGPGETQLEKDRRHIRRRMDNLKAEIEEIRRQRNVNRSRRSKNQVPVLALVGYTNAGKSTLLNALTNAEVPTADKLFATLDPTTRHCRLAETEVLFTDTVGFIQQLPHSLVSAFRATLEEAVYADLLLHVADASHKDLAGQIRTVQRVLEEIGCQDKPLIHVFNKVDRLADPLEIQGYLADYQPAVVISALTGAGLEELKALVLEQLPQPLVTCTFALHPGQGAILSQFYELGAVTAVAYGAEEISGQVVLAKNHAARLQPYLTIQERHEAQDD